MRKIRTVLLLITALCFFSSCSLKGLSSKKIILDNSAKKADARLEQILDTLKNKDKDDLKAMFSKQALDKANDFDDNMEYLFGFFQGSVKSWDRTGFTAPTDVENGKKSVELISWYTVTTDKDTFSFFVIDYSVDTFSPDKVGLYTLRIIKKADEDTQFTYWQDMEIAGIYKP